MLHIMNQTIRHLFDFDEFSVDHSQLTKAFS